MYESVCYRPPFSGNNMDNLFKKITSGKFADIPTHYSPDLSIVIKSMIQVNPKLRPTCLTLLTMESVKKRIEEYFGENYLIEER